MAVTVKEISGAELEQLISGGRLLVDFYSKTCGPCKMLSFVLKDVAKDIEGVEIVMLDYDANKEAVEKYGVEGYPTMIVFDKGQELTRLKVCNRNPKLSK
ncbi:hypothetical protein N752_07950 [Desulforamulus aquiferis]|nr:thioredoxin family protein [Desulforamulus aquiferis]RYD05816.1 hypothetical protein N752_07950 [Desulforamulus aquiferis]